MARALKYPIGTQTFETIIEGGYVYVDKTALIHQLTDNYRYVFLSRPRRFGKSLLVSTLKSYFEGQRALFQGLAIDKLETEWAEYPVLHFDMSGAKHMDVERLERYLGKRLEPYEMHYGITNPAIDANERLNTLIEHAHTQTGQKVVVLIDEYDAPLLDVVHEEEHLPALRQVMRNFYSPLKKCDPHLRFVFLTGITKFSQLSIFSELNNLSNISMDEEYAAICGFTEDEIRSTLMPGVEALAETQGISAQVALAQIKTRYDGYHFCWPSADIYNPFSLLNALSKHALGAYWFESGTPTYLIEMMRKFGMDALQLSEPLLEMVQNFDMPAESLTSITPLLYQSGYLTIKGYDPDSDLYTLSIPNQEIRVALMGSLLPHYVSSAATAQANNTVGRMQGCIRRDDMHGALTHLQTFLATVPQTDNTHYEGHYQAMLYIIFAMMGYRVDVEVRTRAGRIDMVIDNGKHLYIVELKMNQSPEAAMQQIDLKDYPARFALSHMPRVKVGINFSLSERNITDWLITPENK